MNQTNSEWKVQLAISGPIAIKRRETLTVEKGHDKPFWTTVELAPSSHGIIADVVTRAGTSEEANEVAVFFTGQMLDFLCLNVRLPLYVSLHGLQFRQSDSNVKRIIEKEEWSKAFKVGREYGLKRPVFSRALSWHRKGLISQDPIDQLIAYWSSLESLGAKFARSTEKTKKGAINQICDCFDQLWTDVSQWKEIHDRPRFINEVHELRSGIAHGYKPVYPDTVRNIASILPTLSDLAYQFLLEWEKKFSDDESLLVEHQG